MTQLTLDLPYRPAWDRERFLVSASNQDAVAWVDAWPNWPHGLLALVGPPSSGKSHLAAVWQEKSGARRLPPDACAAPQALADRLPGTALVAEDIDRTLSAAGSGQAQEESLLHLINLARERGLSLLLTSRRPPARLGVELPDLDSRLRAIQVAALGEPDDRLLSALLEKHFQDRQIRVPPQVIHYIVTRVERSAEALRSIAERLDREALAAGRPITLPLARRVLEATEGT